MTNSDCLMTDLQVELSDSIETVSSIQVDLECAEECQTIFDFRGNIAVAIENTTALLSELKKLHTLSLSHVDDEQ